MDDKQTIEIMATLGRLDERTEHIVKVLEGNGQPGLTQRVASLEDHKSKVSGALAVLGVIGGSLWGFLEWVFHVKK